MLCFVLFLCAVTVSCSDSGGSTLVDFFSDEDKPDYAGDEFVFAADIDRSEGIYMLYNTNTTFSDVAMTRLDNVAKEYDIKFVQMKGDFVQRLVTSVSSGLNLCDAAIALSYTLQQEGAVSSGLLYPINEMPEINYKDNVKWGEKNLLEAVVSNGNLYGLLPYAWPECMLRTVDFVIVANEDMLAEQGKTDPREYVENGTWTRDKLIEVTNDYAHESNGGETVFGLTFYRPHLYDIALRTSGVEYAVKNDSGEWESGIHTQLGKQALEWVNDFIYENCVDSVLNLPTYDCASAFINGEAAMIMTHTNVALDTDKDTSIAFKVDNFCLLPFPLGDNMTYGEWVGQYDALKYITFPVNIEKPEMSATIMNAVFEPLDGYETSEALEDYYSRFIFHDDRDAEVVYKMLENARYNFYPEGGRAIVDKLGDSSEELSVTQVLESMRDSFADTVKNKIANVYESMDELW